MIKTLLVSVLLTCAWSSQAMARQVFTCEPEWAALAGELGGDRLKITSATRAHDDPHWLEARPGLIAMARSADLVVCTGLGVEQSWLPPLLGVSRNASVQPGAPGYFEAGLYVRSVDVAGDLAGQHILGDPRNVLPIAKALAERLAAIDPGHAAYYDARHRDFAARWCEALVRWQSEAAPLKGMAIAQHHNAWSYLVQWLGLHEVARIETSMGADANAKQLGEVLARLRQDRPRLFLAAPYHHVQAAAWLGRRLPVTVVDLPATVGSDEQAKDLFTLFDDTLNRLLSAARPQAAS